MSWSLEDRDGQIHVYCKGSVQLQWGHVEKISAPFAELKGSQSGKKFQLLQIVMRNHQFSAIFSKYNSSYSSFAKFDKIHDPKEFTEKVQEAVNQLSSEKAKSKTSESSKFPCNKCAEKSFNYTFMPDYVGRKNDHMKLLKTEMVTASVKKIQKTIVWKK